MSSEGNPRSSKQWKSKWQMNNYGFLYFPKVLRFVNKYENLWFSKSIWLDPRNEISDFHKTSLNFQEQQNSKYWILLGTCSKSRGSCIFLSWAPSSWAGAMGGVRGGKPSPGFGDWRVLGIELGLYTPWGHAGLGGFTVSPEGQQVP